MAQLSLAVRGQCLVLLCWGACFRVFSISSTLTALQRQHHAPATAVLGIASSEDVHNHPSSKR